MDKVNKLKKELDMLNRKIITLNSSFQNHMDSVLQGYIVDFVIRKEILSKLRKQRRDKFMELIEAVAGIDFKQLRKLREKSNTNTLNEGEIYQI